MRTRAFALGRGDTRAAGSSCCSERMHERFFSRHSAIETDMFLRTATLVPILLATHVAPALADETPATVRVYALDCGRIAFADLVMFSDTGEYEGQRSEQNTSELQSLISTSYDVFCLNK